MFLSLYVHVTIYLATIPILAPFLRCFPPSFPQSIPKLLIPNAQYTLPPPPPVPQTPPFQTYSSESLPHEHAPPQYSNLYPHSPPPHQKYVQASMFQARARHRPKLSAATCRRAVPRTSTKYSVYISQLLSLYHISVRKKERYLRKRYKSRAGMG